MVEKHGHCSGTTGKQETGFSSKFKLVSVVKPVMTLLT
jgi:hypothetical protein